MNKEKKFKLLCLLLEYLENEPLITFEYIYGNGEEKLTVDEIITNLMIRYME